MEVPLFDVENKGASTDRVKEKLQSMGAVRFHATAVHGADPVKVERELLMALDRMEHRAVYRHVSKHDPLVHRLWWPVVDFFRTLKYDLFRRRKFLRTLDQQ